MLKKLKKHIDKKITKWVCIWNEDTQTDGGTSLRPYAKGRIEAYKEILSTIKKYENK
tara:strand:- start:1326 stop:1496 length:171 start_codon:yes stop_codon:yes gene_type:complete